MKKSIFFLFALLAVTAYAADKKVSELNALPAASFATGDLLPIVDISANETKKTSIADFDTRYGLSFTAPLVNSSNTISCNVASGVQAGCLSSADWSTFNGKQAALGFTPEDVANKDTDGTLAANSDTKYASQKATKTYVDNAVGTSWLKAGNAGTTPGTDFLGTTDNKDLVIKTNGSDQLVFNASGGMYSIQNLVPANSTSKYIASLQANYNPSASTTGDYNIVLPVTGNYDQGNAGFNSGTVEAISPRITHGGSGTIDYASIVDATAYFGPNAGTTTLYKGLNSDTQIASGYTVTQYASIQSSLNTTGGIVNGSLAEIGSSIVDSDITNFTGINLNQGFSGTFSSVQSINGEAEFMNFSNSSSVGGGIYLRNTGITLQDTASATNGVTGDNLNLQFNGSSNPGSVTGAGFTFGLNNSSTAANGVTGITVNGHIGDTATAGNVILENLYLNLDGSAHIQSFSVTNANPEIQGSSIIDNGFNVGGFYGQVRGNSSVAYVNGLTGSPTISGSAAVTGDVLGLQVNPQVQGSATVGGSLVGGRISAQKTGGTVTGGITGLDVIVGNNATVSQATGINVDMSAANVGGGNLRSGVSISEATLNANAKYTVQTGDTFFMLNYLGGSETVASGSPVSAYGFGNNLAHTIDFQDDWTVDVAGLGYNDVGFVGSITGAVGKTMHMWTGALGGAGNPSGAGTLTNATMFKAAGVLPQGGSLAVTNMYGFQVDPNLFGVIGTNVWGFHNGGTSENFMKKLAINTSTEKVGAGIALDVSGKIKTDDALVLEDPGAGTNKLSLKASTMASDLTLFLPAIDGSAGDCVKTDGSGNLSFGSCTGGGGITSLGGQTGSTQTFATGTSGSDFNISSATDTHTFNLPDAGAAARGVINTIAQTIAGVKTFTSNLILSNAHLKSTGTAPVATVDANAGSGASCSVSNATDNAGKITLATTASSSAAGAQCSVAFNTAFGVAPICVLTPANVAASLAHGVYLGATTSALSLNFANNDQVGDTYIWNYTCQETQ